VTATKLDVDVDFDPNVDLDGNVDVEPQPMMLQVVSGSQAGRS
jgi:hypothetical protein